MAKPQAYYIFSGTGLTLYFTSLSINQPTSLLWDFGDGTTSTDESPSHAYINPGYYEVKLSATNVDGSDIFTTMIQVLSSGMPGYRPIYFMVSDILPANTGVSDTFIADSIRTNQLIIAPQLSPSIAEDKVHNEAYYPPLANMLVAKLTAIDVLILGANSYLASLSSASTESTSGSQVKKITTGPTDVEWFDGSKQWTEILKPGGTFQLIQQDACNLAQRLFIQLPFCPAIESPIIPMSVTTPRNIYISPDNQFTK